MSCKQLRGDMNYAWPTAEIAVMGGAGAGAESRVAMGIAVVGGMVCATFLSLFVIPAIYSYLSTEKVNVIGEEHKE